MSRRCVFLPLVALALTGCAATPAKETVSSTPTAPTSAAHELSPQARASGSTQRPVAAADPVKLAAFEVKESAFSDFGMSVRTNVEVQWGGGIEWMRVGAVAAASSASSVGLAPGDRILAIDNRAIATLTRDDMLATLFARKRGESSRMLVLGRSQALPHFVRLVANPPGRDGSSKTG